ncbi:MAG: FAD:protein FMN transferase [Dehalogenimonas sp.]
MEKINRRDFVRISAIGAGALALGAIGIRELIASKEAKEVSQTQKLLGTLITIKLIDADEERAGSAISETFGEVERLSALLSRFDPASELSILNSTGAIHNASPELLGVIQKAKNFSEMTDGAFDVTVLPLLQLYTDSFADGGEPPSEKSIDATRELVDYRQIDITGQNISLGVPRMSITLDGIAKGYIVDQAAGVLRNKGFSQVLVAASGDMSLRGTRQDGELWKIGINHPRALAGCYEVFQTSNTCLATSGDYENAFTPDYSWNHIIDPRIGHSPREVASATIIAPDAFYADALATASVVLGITDAVALCEKLPGTQAFIIDKAMNSHTTSGFESVVHNATKE